MTEAVGFLEERADRLQLPERLTVEEVARLLIIDTVTAYRWLHKGYIPGHQKGRTWLIYRDEVVAEMQDDLERRRAAWLAADEDADPDTPPPGDDQQP